MTPRRFRYASFFTGIGGLLDYTLHRLGWECVGMVEKEPAAQAVLRKNFPDTLLMGDINDVHATDFAGQPDVVALGFPCFMAGTLITTQDGLTPIEDVKVGQLVLTHERRWRPVTRVMAKHEAPTVAVKALGGGPVLTTAEHPFYARLKTLVWDNEKRRHVRSWGDPEWVNAADLTRDHFLGAPLDHDGTSDGIGAALAYLMGRWLGDGWTQTGPRAGRDPARSRNWKVIICCAYDEADDLAARISEAGFHATRSDERTAVRFIICSNALVEQVADFGTGAAGKKIPGWVFDLPADDRAAMIRGWLDADGAAHSTRNAETASTVSRELAYGMARLIRQTHNVPVSIHPVKARGKSVIEGRTVNNRPQFEVVFGPTSREAFIEDGYVWAPVRSVTPTGETATVHNLSVQGDETYVADGFTVHNCTDTSIAAPHRLGLAGLRSGLFFEGLRILDEFGERPEWVIIENPEGVLGSNGGRDWYTVLRSLADRGYGFAYRVVDGRHLGRSPQQRRRVLLVAHRDGDPTPCLSVLGLPGGGGEADAADRVVARRRPGARPPIADSDAGRTDSGHLIFRKSARARAALDKGGYETWVPAEHANTLTTFDGGGPARQTHLVVEPDGRVRALTVIEWERLSGFPDDWTAGVMPDRKGNLVPIPDAARQKMLGNCVHLGTGEWLGERLVAVHAAMHGTDAATA